MRIFLTYHPVIEELFQLTNKVRAENGLSEVARCFALDQAAQWMAQDKFENDYIGHQDSRGRSVLDRAMAYGYPGYQGWFSVGENIGSGHPTPESAIEGWMNSEGHRINLLRENWVSVGLGHCARRWVQVFGSV